MSNQVVQNLWNYCNVLRDDGTSYGDYVEQLTYLPFFKVAEVERRLSVVEELETASEANLTRADRLRQLILHQAFAGNLVSSVTDSVSLRTNKDELTKRSSLRSHLE